MNAKNRSTAAIIFWVNVSFRMNRNMKNRVTPVPTIINKTRFKTKAGSSYWIVYSMMELKIRLLNAIIMAKILWLTTDATTFPVFSFVSLVMR